MRPRIQFVAPLIFLALPSASSMARTHARTDCAQSCIEKIPKLTGVAHQEGLHRPTWNLKYKSGSFQLKSEQWLKAEFLQDGSSEKHPNPIISMSADQIRVIYFDPKAQKDSDVAQRMPRSGCAYAASRMPGAASAPASATLSMWPSSPGFVLRAAEHLNQRHAVRFAWNDNGRDKKLVLTVNQCEYASFLANLRWFVGDRWPEIARKTQ